MRNLTFTTAILAATALPAFAHPGHMAGLAGHDHWVAGAAIGTAIAVGVWGVLKGRRKSGSNATTGDKSDASPDDCREPQES